jgi:hypothetical protein
MFLRTAGHTGIAADAEFRIGYHILIHGRFNAHENSFLFRQT